MADPDRPIDELLPAYLVGELADHEAAALEARLAAEPHLSERLDTTHELVVALSGLEEVEPPAGYQQRLRERIAAARAADDRGPLPVAALAGRHERRVVWATVGGVAAGVALLGVLVGGVLTSSQSEEGARVAMPLRANGTRQGSAAPDLPSGAQAPVPPDAGVPEAQVQAGSDAGRTLPIVADGNADLPDDEAVRTHFSGQDRELLGTSRAVAVQEARASQAALRAAAPLQSGAPPGACLEVLLAEAAGPLVVARVESVRYRGDPGLAFVLVGASVGADTLDRVELWLVDPGTCATRLFQTLT